MLHVVWLRMIAPNVGTALHTFTISRLSYRSNAIQMRKMNLRTNGRRATLPDRYSLSIWGNG